MSADIEAYLAARVDRYLAELCDFCATEHQHAAGA
jgi:hypothetical protein